MEQVEQATWCAKPRIQWGSAILQVGALPLEQRINVFQYFCRRNYPVGTVSAVGLGPQSKTSSIGDDDDDDDKFHPFLFFNDLRQYGACKQDGLTDQQKYILFFQKHF
jgi:hypothetical protein